jgi:hypothetical protein
VYPRVWAPCPGRASRQNPHILIRTDPRWPEQFIDGRQAALAFYRVYAFRDGLIGAVAALWDTGVMVLAVGVVAWAVIASAIVIVGSVVLGRWMQRKGRDIERRRGN